MNIFKYLDNLPETVLLKGKFCVTRIGDKQPFDPFKGFTISAKDPFYSIDELIELGVDEYETFGIKVMGDISSIDIDHCVTNGVPDKVAQDVIDSIGSYTEISPSGTGIRILFTALNEFDRKRYKIKNSSRGLEYYDGVDQITKGGRMVRLSADRLNNYDFKAVDTTDVLDRYMAKDYIETNTFDEGEINKTKCYFVGEYLKKDHSIYDVYYRHMSSLSESEWDLILANHISFYANNLNEIRYIFENTGYHKAKDSKHVRKWNDTTYAENMFKIVRPTLANQKVLNYVQMFDEYEPQEEYDIDQNLLVHIAIQIGFIKPSYMSKYDVSPIVSDDEQTIVNHLLEIAKHRRGILKYLQSLYTKKE